jgi:Formyl transferase
MARLILLSPITGEALMRLAALFGAGVEIISVSDLEGLRAVAVDKNTGLLSFGSSVILSSTDLARFTMPVYNLHAASPDFPGRDPHHHAIYRRSATYGATLHAMTARVDEGAIVAVEMFDVAHDDTPVTLLARANETGFRLIARLGSRLLEPAPLPALPSIVWGTVKTRRADMQRLARLSPLVSKSEFAHLHRAFDGDAHDNLTLELHGHLFRIDRNASRAEFGEAADNGFTEAGFRALLWQLKAANYQFSGYGDAPDSPHVIWRHDVDFSMHRALALARIEAEENVRATYFVNPRSAYYNLAEPEIVQIAAAIRAFGHTIGLHFDAGAYDTSCWNRSALDAAVARERKLLEHLLEAPITCMSWHNPDQSNLLAFTDDMIGGMHNAYGAALRHDYTYCSDSNGYWRFKPMPDVIAEGHAKLHLLTHPEWWTPEPIPPSARLDRAILGRARATRAAHDALIAKAGRKNVTD